MPPDPPIMDGMLLQTVAVAVLASELICFYFLKSRKKIALPKNLKVDLSYISFILLYTQTCSANAPQKRTPTILISRSPNPSV